MPDCSRCTKRTGDRKLTRTTITYDEDWRLTLCPSCHKDWDWAIWTWLNSAEEQRNTEAYPACFRCGGYPALDQIEVGYSKRTWYLRLCESDSEQWTTFLWSWLNLAEKLPRPFEWVTPVRLSGVPTPTLLATAPPASVPALRSVTARSSRALDPPVSAGGPSDDLELSYQAAERMVDAGLRWHQILEVLQHPVAVADTECEGVQRYMSPTLTVFVDQTARLVVGLKREEGYVRHEYSANALAHVLLPHVLERMALRNISGERVRRAIDDPNRITRPGDTADRVVYVTSDLTIVVVPSRREVLSAWWRGCEDSVAS